MNNNGDKKELYFLALMPPLPVAQKIHRLKEEIAEKYNSRHSLKVPEHVTLIPPFRCEDEELKVMSEAVALSLNTCSHFEIILKNFGHFNNKIIFMEAF